MFIGTGVTGIWLRAGAVVLLVAIAALPMVFAR
jgi:hypothetical protein